MPRLTAVGPQQDWHRALWLDPFKIEAVNLDEACVTAITMTGQHRYLVEEAAVDVVQALEAESFDG